MSSTCMCVCPLKPVHCHPCNDSHPGVVCGLVTVMILLVETGLREDIVTSPEAVMALLARGEAHRHFGETKMNTNSSRSHTLFRMVSSFPSWDSQEMLLRRPQASWIAVSNLLSLIALTVHLAVSTFTQQSNKAPHVVPRWWRAGRAMRRWTTAALCGCPRSRWSTLPAVSDWAKLVRNWSGHIRCPGPPTQFC